METFALILKYTLICLSGIGIIFHLLILRNPLRGDDVEKQLQKEYGVKTRIVPKIEEPNMQIHQKLINSKVYNVCATIFLILVLLLLSR